MTDSLTDNNTFLFVWENRRRILSGSLKHVIIGSALEAIFIYYAQKAQFIAELIIGGLKANQYDLAFFIRIKPVYFTGLFDIKFH